MTSFFIFSFQSILKAKLFWKYCVLKLFRSEKYDCLRILDLQNLYSLWNAWIQIGLEMHFDAPVFDTKAQFDSSTAWFNARLGTFEPAAKWACNSSYLTCGATTVTTAKSYPIPYPGFVL